MSRPGEALASDDAIQVGIAEFAVTDDGDELASFGLGSCVAIALRDADASVGGLAHVMLPSADDVEGEVPTKFADAGTRAMVEEMEALGADRSTTVGKMAGGSEMFEFSGIGKEVGKRNVAAVREVLDELGIEIESEDVGGEHGRSVAFDTTTGTLSVSTAHDEVETL